jgi:hypothetical protein
MFHEEKCPNKNTDLIKTCLYNPNHKIHKDIFNEHLNTCPNRPNIGLEQQEKLKAYVENKQKQAEINRIIYSQTNFQNNNVRTVSDNTNEMKINDKIQVKVDPNDDEEKNLKEVINNKEKIRKEEKEMMKVIDDNDSNNDKRNVIENEEIINKYEEEKITENYLNRKTKFDAAYKYDEYHSAEEKLYNNENNDQIKLEKKEISDSDDESSSKEEEGDYKGEEFNNFF